MPTKELTATPELVQADDVAVGRRGSGDPRNLYLTRLPYRAVTGSSATVAATDGAGIIDMQGAGSNTVTVPLQASSLFPVQTTVLIVNGNASGTTTVQGATGVTINGVSGGALTLTTIAETVCLFQRTANDWIAINRPDVA
jgi:hypothetical protein